MFYVHLIYGSLHRHCLRYINIGLFLASVHAIWSLIQLSHAHVRPSQTEGAMPSSRQLSGNYWYFPRRVSLSTPKYISYSRYDNKYIKSLYFCNSYLKLKTVSADIRDLLWLLFWILKVIVANDNIWHDQAENNSDRYSDRSMLLCFRFVSHFKIAMIIVLSF